MSNRTIRINELIQRELGSYLHTKYQEESVAITVSGVEVAPDLKTGRIFVSIIGEEDVQISRMKWLRSKAAEIRSELGRRVVLKHTPEWFYVLDKAHVRSNRVLQILDEISEREKTKPRPE
ncbi:MAG TPA: 30S ribosome-binding factor RbfA [Opitutaceae bacterium]